MCDDGGAFVGGAAIGALISGLAIGLWVHHVTRQNVVAPAIEKGWAHYQADPISGDVELVWKYPPQPEKAQ